MKKLIVVLICFVAMKPLVFSQDIHFSQYNETPSLVNPALTGSQYVMRASLNYKDQWGSVTVPYRTYGASVEMKFKASSWDKVDPYRTKSYKKAFNRLAGGLSFFGDKAGDGAMATNLVNLSLATYIKTGEFSMMSFGAQGGMVQKSVDFNKFVFSNQYNGSTYDKTPAIGEDYSSHNVMYADLSAGVLYRYDKEEQTIGDNDQLMWDVGFAVAHINKPKQKFLIDSDERLYTKFNVHGKLLMGIPHTSIGIAPSCFAQFQGPQKELLAGMMVKYYFKHDSKYTGYIRKSSGGIGIYYRNRDAVILSVLLEMGQYAIGVSYDLNTSGLAEVSTLRGGPEVTIRFNSANRFLFQKKG
jgi:type IX secretion system PorP/SprF family membrane protein